MHLSPSGGIVMIELVGSATERTTAATDAALGLLAVAGALYLTRAVPPSFARRIWQAALAGLSLASVLGAIAPRPADE